MNSKKVKANVSDSKKKTVSEMENLLGNNKTVLIASIKNIPGSQFQEITKKLRGKAVIKVPKKSLINRVLEESKTEELKKIKEKISESFAVLFSNLDCFDLASELLKNKTPAKAKAGQEAPDDIEVDEGPTELVPGPAISELESLGIKIQIEKGKISIKERKVIAKKGEKISKAASELMNKLDIKPFSVGFVPLAAFDINEKKLYANIEIDSEKALSEIKELFGKALGFAMNLNYLCGDTIKLFISKASVHEKKLNRIVSGEPEEIAETPEEKPAEEKPKEEKKEAEKSVAGLASLFG